MSVSNCYQEQLLEWVSIDSRQFLLCYSVKHLKLSRYLSSNNQSVISNPFLFIFNHLLRSPVLHKHSSFVCLLITFEQKSLTQRLSVFCPPCYIHNSFSICCKQHHPPSEQVIPEHFQGHWQFKRTLDKQRSWVLKNQVRDLLNSQSMIIHSQNNRGALGEKTGLNVSQAAHALAVVGRCWGCGFK